MKPCGEPEVAVKNLESVFLEYLGQTFLNNFVTEIRL